MSRYADNVSDQYGRPVSGAAVYVYDQNEQLAALTADGGGALTNPVTTDTSGAFYFNATDGIYSLEVYLNGRKLFRDEAVQVGAGLPLPDSVLLALGASSGASLLGTSTGDTAQEWLNTQVKGRLAPHSDFNFLANRGITVTRCGGRGAVEFSTNLRDAWDALHPQSGIPGPAVYVAPWGSDSNDGATPGNAFATIGKALDLANAVTCDTVIVYAKPNGGLYAPPSYRYDTSYQPTYAKRMIGIGRPKIGYAGDDISTATWTSVGGATPNTWKVQLTGTTHVERVLQTNILDEYGEPLPLRMVAAESPANDAARDAMVAAIEASTMGWGWDGRAGQRWLYVRFSAQNVETTTKANLKAIYSPANRDGKILLMATTSYWEGFDLIGAYFHVLAVAGQPQPEAWIYDCVPKYGRGKAITNAGGVTLVDKVRVHRCQNDGAGYDLTAGFTPYGFEGNDFQTEACGDPATYDDTVSDPPQRQRWNPSAPLALNKQGSSNHDGIVIRGDGSHRGNAGQAVADTGGKTWMLGGLYEGEAITTDGSAIGIYMQNNQAWIDGSVGTGRSGGLISDGATVHIWNFAGTRSTLNGGTITEAAPATP